MTTPRASTCISRLGYAWRQICKHGVLKGAAAKHVRAAIHNLKQMQEPKNNRVPISLADHLPEGFDVDSGSGQFPLPRTDDHCAPRKHRFEHDGSDDGLRRLLSENEKSRTCEVRQKLSCLDTPRTCDPDPKHWETVIAHDASHDEQRAFRNFVIWAFEVIAELSDEIH